LRGTRWFAHAGSKRRAQFFEKRDFGFNHKMMGTEYSRRRRVEKIFYHAVKRRKRQYPRSQYRSLVPVLGW
jgi:hypothetical protein